MLWLTDYRGGLNSGGKTVLLSSWTFFCWFVSLQLSGPEEPKSSSVEVSGNNALIGKRKVTTEVIKHSVGTTVPTSYLLHVSSLLPSLTKRCLFIRAKDAGEIYINHVVQVGRLRAVKKNERTDLENLEWRSWQRLVTKLKSIRRYWWWYVKFILYILYDTSAWPKAIFAFV